MALNAEAFMNSVSRPLRRLRPESCQVTGVAIRALNTRFCAVLASNLFSEEQRLTCHSMSKENSWQMMPHCAEQTVPPRLKQIKDNVTRLVSVLEEVIQQTRYP